MTKLIAKVNSVTRSWMVLNAWRFVRTNPHRKRTVGMRTWHPYNTTFAALIGDLLLIDNVVCVEANCIATQMRCILTSCREAIVLVQSRKNMQSSRLDAINTRLHVTSCLGGFQLRKPTPSLDRPMLCSMLSQKRLSPLSIHKQFCSNGHTSVAHVKNRSAGAVEVYS